MGVRITEVWLYITDGFKTIFLLLFVRLIAPYGQPPSPSGKNCIFASGHRARAFPSVNLSAIICSSYIVFRYMFFLQHFRVVYPRKLCPFWEILFLFESSCGPDDARLFRIFKKSEKWPKNRIFWYFLAFFQFFQPSLNFILRTFISTVNLQHFDI